MTEEQIRQIKGALEKAKKEIEWWVYNHGCCAGHEDETGTMAAIDSALKILESTDNGPQTV